MRDVTLEETVYFNFTTRAFASGVPTALAGTPALSVLESNNATPITSGVSLQQDRGSVTGLNQATVVATAANGYEAGKSYSVYISTGTVGGVSVVGEVVAQFTVQDAPVLASLTASERNIRQMIESQRGHHTACGAVFYVKKGGNDSNAGTYAAPFLTIQAALNACTANAHDTVIVLGATGSSPSSFSEVLTMSKAYVFLRGMGRDTQVTTAGAASTTLTISAAGCEVSGLWVNNTGTGATKGISTASGADFAWLHHLFVDGAATGIDLTAATNVTVENCRLNDCATTGINVAQGAAVGTYSRILSNHVDGSTTGVNFAGGDSSESLCRYNAISGCTTGVVVASGALKVQITDNRFSGNTTDWTDAGTNTNLSWNALSTTIAGVATANTTQLAGQTVTAAAGVTFPTSVASPTNITAGTITTVSGNVDGSVASVTGAVGSVTSAVTVGTISANVITASALATDAVNEIADGVWDEALSGHTTAGTAGKALSDAGAAGDPWGTALPGAYGAGTAGKILSRIPDVAAGASGGIFIAGANATTTVDITGNLSGSVGSVTGAVGSVTGAVGSVTGNVGGNVTGSVGSVVGAVGSVTGNVGGNVTGSVGSVVGAVGSVTGNVGGNVSGSVGSVTAEVTANVTKISGSAAAADNLEESTEAIAYGTVDGTGATTTVFLTSALTPDAGVIDQFKGRVLIFKADTTTAVLRGQATTISSHTFTSAEVIELTVVALTTAPSTGDTFVIL